jgi:uncharacterized membrane protein YozB (DUF420 family)
VQVSDLPTINAALNFTSAVLIAMGWWHVRRGRIATHRRFMLSACVTSLLFLITYVIYHAHVGSRPFPGTGVARVFYFSILVPHVVLAAGLLPLVGVTLARGLRRRDAAHRRIARITFPIWLFVSVTGVMVYVMLYQWY